LLPKSSLVIGQKAEIVQSIFRCKASLKLNNQSWMLNVCKKAQQMTTVSVKDLFHARNSGLAGEQVVCTCTLESCFESCFCGPWFFWACMPVLQSPRPDSFECEVVENWRRTTILAIEIRFRFVPNKSNTIA